MNKKALDFELNRILMEKYVGPDAAQAYDEQARMLEGRFTEGESVDVAEYLRDHGNPDAADKWEEMNDEYGDLLKTADWEEGHRVPDEFSEGEGSMIPGLEERRGSKQADWEEGHRVPDEFSEGEGSMIPGLEERMASLMTMADLRAVVAKFPPAAYNFNKIPDSDGFWKWPIGEAARNSGLSMPNFKDIGDAIFWLNMAAIQWESMQKKTAGDKTATGVPEGMTSDDYFIQQVVPLITKAEMTKKLAPLGLTPRGKGSVDKRKKMVELLVDRPQGDKGMPFRVVMSGSYMFDNDGEYDVHVESTGAGTHQYHEKFTGDAQRDAGIMVATLKDLLGDFLSIEKRKKAASDKTANQIAKTILEQMGGARRLMAMLGVKQFVALPNGVFFIWPNPQRSKGNAVEITLNGMDLYDMKFLNVAKGSKKLVKEISDVYFDQLVEIFERQTGWYLRLASEDGMEAKFEEGKPADPTENMSPEDKKKWWEEHDKNKDKFKEAMDQLADVVGMDKTANHRPLYEIAKEIRRDWKNVNFAAKPYLDAMSDLDQVTDNYGWDSGTSVVAYFLSNASGWKGDVAKAIKKELQTIMKSGRRGSIGQDIEDMAHLAALAGEDDEIEARFEEGKPADPTENMSEEDAKKWRLEHLKNKDNFKEKDADQHTRDLLACQVPRFLSWSTAERLENGNIFINGAELSFDPILKKAKISPRVPAGTRVMLQANPMSRALYTWELPPDGTVGVVTPIALPGGRGTYIPGPWGGMVYVKWPDGAHYGVSPLDLVKAPAEKNAGLFNRTPMDDRQAVDELWDALAEENDDEKEGKFEEGKPADPTKNMSPEDKKKWEKYHGQVEKLAELSGPDIDTAFKQLTEALSNTGLPTSDGKYRTKVDSGEFMLMGSTGKEWKFQHRGTHNFLLLDKQSGTVVVPTGTKDSLQGFYDKTASIKKWDSKFMPADKAKLLGDSRFNYVPFHQLSPQDQSHAVRMYPHKSVGAKYDFIDEHYYYPVGKDGRLGKGRRTLAIPHNLIMDDHYMASLGYTVSPKWNPKSAALSILACAPTFHTLDNPESMDGLAHTLGMRLAAYPAHTGDDTTWTLRNQENEIQVVFTKEGKVNWSVVPKLGRNEHWQDAEDVMSSPVFPLVGHITAILASVNEEHKTAAKQPSGLYGYTRRIQADCETCIRKLTRSASKLAKSAWQKDEQVAPFLAAHAKRTGSMTARILVESMKGLGPKVASTMVDAAAGDAPSGLTDSQEKIWNHLWKIAINNGDAHAKRDANEAVFKAWQEYKDELHWEVDHDFVTIKHKLNAAVAAYWDKMSKSATRHGLYGFSTRTAALGLQTCNALHEIAGHYASDLHTRRAEHHASITGFFKQHSKESKCMYSRLMHASYPDVPASKKASTPNTVQGWLDLEV